MYELHTPVNPKAVVKYIGYYLIAFAFVLFVPAIAALVLGNMEGVIAYGIIAALVFTIGQLIYRSLPDYDLETKEALIIVALVFPISAFLSAIPMSLTTGMTFIDAYFESVSACSNCLA